MRADRLVGILLLLQRTGSVTAAQVAAEFEISERTARRDLDALGAAGIPVYSVQGRGGGWRLLGEGRTDLTGLSAGEVRALFRVVGPGVSTAGELGSALRKLSSALPGPLRVTAETTVEAVVVDRKPWDHRVGSDRSAPPLLDDVQAAVIDGKQVVLGYVGRDGRATERTVHPLGLAAKGANWYLVAESEAGRRTFRVDRISSVETTGFDAVRPEGFDLQAAWNSVTERVQELRLPVVAHCRARVDWLGRLRFIFGDRLAVGEAVADGWVAIEIRGPHVEPLAGELAGFGAAVEVRTPVELRTQLGGVGRELVALYS